MDEEPTNNETAKHTHTTKPFQLGFIPKLRGKKVIIRLISGGQPITGTIEAFNPYELLLQTAKGQLLVFKHAIATIEVTDEPKGYKASRTEDDV